MNLNKENFWNDLRDKYPTAVDKFCKWIDEYKIKVGWDKLFGNDIDPIHYKPVQIKFHDIPVEMQAGIITAFISEVLPEYNIDVTLEGVKSATTSVFKLLEEKEQ